MENNIYTLIKEVSLESILIAIFIFALTMIVKMPIKKATSKLKEEKMKAINSLITFIPLFLSIIISIIYYGIKDSNWFSIEILENSTWIWLLSLSFYAIYEKVLVFIKGCLTGNLEDETINDLKLTIKNLLKHLNLNEKELSKINNKIIKLDKIRESLVSLKEDCNLEELSKINIKIKELFLKENTLKKQSDSIRKQIQDLNNKTI